MPLIVKAAYVISLALASLVFIFALISGSEAYGGGFSAIIKNSPNALPWLLYMVLILASLKWRKSGSAALVVFTAFLVYFFNWSGPNFFMVTFLMTALALFMALIIAFFAYGKKLNSGTI